MTLHVIVGIPGAVAPAGVTDLNEADAPLDQPPRQEQLLAINVGLLLANAIQALDRIGFL